MLACFRAIYVDGIELADAKSVDKIMKKLTLNVDDARAFEKNHDWQQWADVNQVALNKLNLWGVPCFTYGQSSYWGQDRIPLLEKEIKSTLSNG